MTTYRRAPEVAQIAERLVRDVEQHKPLVDARIEYVFRDVASRSKGRVTLAKARRVSGLGAFLVAAETADEDWEANTQLFVVEVAEDTWERLEPEQRKALVDHELCHLRIDYNDAGEPVLSIRGHDLEEFACVVERHGLWKSDVAHFGSQLAEQMALAIDEAERFLGDVADPDDDGGDS